MTALAEALDAAQAKALAALEKAYVRGTLDAEARPGEMESPLLVCACELSYVCASCRDSSRFDDVYADFREPDPVFVGGEATDDD